MFLCTIFLNDASFEMKLWIAIDIYNCLIFSGLQVNDVLADITDLKQDQFKPKKKKKKASSTLQEEML